MGQAKYFSGTNLFVDVSDYPDLKVGAEVEIGSGRGVVKSIKSGKAEIIIETLDIKTEQMNPEPQDDPNGVDHEDEIGEDYR